MNSFLDDSKYRRFPLGLLFLFVLVFSLSRLSFTLIKPAYAGVCDGGCSVASDAYLHDGACGREGACDTMGPDYCTMGVPTWTYYLLHTVSGNCWVRIYEGLDCTGCSGGGGGAPPGPPAPPAPINLTVLNVAVTPAKPMTGQTTSVTATIKNDGTSGTAAEFWVMLTLDCVPDVLDASCARTGAQRLTALGAGAEQSVTFPDLPAISGTGSHTYYVKADYGTEIMETNESDNVGSVNFNVCGVSTKPTINNPPVCSNIATPQLTVTDRGGSCYPHDAYFLVESKIGGIYSFAQNNWMYNSLVSLNSQASWNLSSALAQGVYRWLGAAKPAGVDTSFMTYSDPSTDFAVDLTKPQAPPNLSVTTGCTGGPGTGTATITWSASSD